jgi:hypothetical protein
VKSQCYILTSSSEIIASKCLERQKHGCLYQRTRTLLKDWYKYRVRPKKCIPTLTDGLCSRVSTFFWRTLYVVPNIVVKVKGQSNSSGLQKKQRNVFQFVCTWTIFMAPLVAFYASDPLFAASVSSIHPWTVPALCVNVWIFFTRFYETGLLTIFGVKRWWPSSSHVYHERLKHFRH